MPRNKSRAEDVGIPPQHPAPAPAVKQLQEMVRNARALLIAPTPENLNECRRRVEKAVHLLRQLQTGLPSGDVQHDSSLRAPLGELRAEIARLSTLLESAAAFHSGWVRLAASMTAGYTADGTPGRPEPMRRVWMEV